MYCKKSGRFWEHLFYRKSSGDCFCSLGEGRLKQLKYIDIDYIYCIRVRKFEIPTFITANKKLDGLLLWRYPILRSRWSYLWLMANRNSWMMTIMIMIIYKVKYLLRKYWYQSVIFAVKKIRKWVEWMLRMFGECLNSFSVDSIRILYQKQDIWKNLTFLVLLRAYPAMLTQGNRKYLKCTPALYQNLDFSGPLYQYLLYGFSFSMGHIAKAFFWKKKWWFLAGNYFC